MANLTTVLRRVGDTAYFDSDEVVDVNAIGHFGNRPMHVAATWGDCEAIDILVAAGARLDDKGEHGFTPLMEAAAQGHLAACERLVEHGAASTRNDQGDLPSQHALLLGHVELAEWLASRGF